MNASGINESAHIIALLVMFGCVLSGGMTVNVGVGFEEAYGGRLGLDSVSGLGLEPNAASDMEMTLRTHSVGLWG